MLPVTALASAVSVDVENLCVSHAQPCASNVLESDLLLCCAGAMHAMS